MIGRLDHIGIHEIPIRQDTLAIWTQKAPCLPSQDFPFADPGLSPVLAPAVWGLPSVEVHEIALHVAGELSFAEGDLTFQHQAGVPEGCESLPFRAGQREFTEAG